MAVIGILIVTNEYRHGTIMTTFLAEPHRIRVLLAKLSAAGIVGLVFAVAALAGVGCGGAAVALGARRVAAAGRPGARGRRPGAARVRSDGACSAAAVGAIVQSQVGAIVGWFMWILVVESLVTVISGLVFTDVGEPDPVSKFLPGSSLGGIVGGEGNEFLLSGGGAAAARDRLRDRVVRARRSLDHPPRPLTTTLRRWPRR